MSKRRNRNRSAKRDTTNATPTNSFEDRAYTYAQHFRRKIKAMSWDYALSVGMDMDELRIRRKVAVANRLKDDFIRTMAATGWNDRNEAENIWMHLTMGLVMGPDIMDKENYSNLAAAIWILDHLAECGRFDDACNLFPVDPAVYEEQHLPVVRDLCHEERAIRGMLWIIQHRNDDCVGLKEKDNAPFPRTYMDAYTTTMMHHQDVPSRNRFTEILAMLPHDAVEEALASYDEAYENVLRLMLKSYQIIYARRNEILDAQATVNVAAYAVASNAFLSSQKTNMELSKVMTSGISTAAPHICSPESIEKHTNTLQAHSLLTRGATLDRELLDLGGVLSRLTGSIYMNHIMSEDQRNELYTPELCNLWTAFKVKDPYALCFAYLYLLDGDSDLPWVYGISCNIMGFCANALPWMEPYSPSGTEQYIPLDFEVPHVEDSVSLYDTYFPDRVEYNVDHAKYYNLSQIIYQRTGYILPRKVYDYDATMDWLDRFGLRDSAYHYHLLNTATLLNALSNRTQVHSPMVEDSTAEAPDVDDLLQKIRVLEQEKKALRLEAYEASRDARNLRDKLNNLSMTTENYRQELADLRELVFLGDTVATEEPEYRAIAFPQRTSKKIVVFGGHPVWYNEIHKKLPDVQFFRHETKPSPHMIRNADEIWFQTNALSHKLYYAVMNRTAGYPVKIRYFHSTSATKCAEELIQAQSA